MVEAQTADSILEPERLDAAIDEAIAACGGDMRATIRALILACQFFEEEAQRNVSAGFKRGVRHGRLNTYSG